MSVPEFAEVRFAAVAETRNAFDDLPPVRIRPLPQVKRFRFHVPVLTAGLLLGLLLIFAAEQLFSVDATPGFDLSGPTLTALGALDAVLAFGQGEWWRIATAPFLHANLAHILGNSLVLLFAGWTLERLVGRGWLVALFVLSALGGAAGALMLNPGDLPTVGASGAIMGLLATIFVLSFHMEAFTQRWRLRLIVGVLAVPALIPTASAPGASALVDFSSHFGGAATGVLMGFVLQAIWTENAERPLFSAFAAKV